MDAKRTCTDVVVPQKRVLTKQERLGNLSLLIGEGWFQRQRLAHLVTEFVTPAKHFVQVQLQPTGTFLTFKGREKLEIGSSATGRDIYEQLFKEKKGCIVELFMEASLKRRLPLDDPIKPGMVLFATLNNLNDWKLRTLVPLDDDSDSDSDDTDDSDSVCHMCYTPDGNILTAKISRVTLLSDNGRVIKNWKRLAQISCLSYASDGSQRFAIGHYNGALKIIDEITDQITIVENYRFGNTDGHVASINCIAFSKQGLVATGSKDFTIKLWDSVSGSHIATLGNPRHKPLPNDPDAHIWPMGKDDTSDRDKLGHTNNVHAIDFTRDGQRLVSGSKDKTIRVWSVTEHRLLQTIRVFIPVCAVSLNRGATLVAVGGHEIVKILTLQGKCLHRFPHTDIVIDLQWDTPECIISTSMNEVKILSATAGQCVRSFGCVGCDGEIYTARMSPEGDTLAISTCDGVYICCNTHI